MKIKQSIYRFGWPWLFSFTRKLGIDLSRTIEPDGTESYQWKKW